MPRENTNLALKLLAWSKKHGRKNLPWQHTSDPYPIWLSEIMLQQTQVSTVINYFERFTGRFPTIKSLADAPLDEVLAIWSGLGYYARARNLHKAARIIAADYNGAFPKDYAEIIELPGIGKSTAGAILAFSDNQRHPILDGNVKRVLSRYYAVEGYPGKRDVEQKLWQLADENTPAKKVSVYTQAIMDLGATVCTRKKPQCPDCPLNDSCAANRMGLQSQMPTPKPKKSMPTRQVIMLVISNSDSHVLLERRPPSGIWGGLWSLPECDVDTDIRRHCMQRLGLAVTETGVLAQFKHSFSHYHLIIRPHQLTAIGTLALKEDRLNWFEPHQVNQLGLPKPVKSVLDDIKI